MFDQGVSETITSENDVLFGEASVRRPSILLHSCCGPCSTAVVERLSPRFDITLYFCNSNIDDEEEYKKRLRAQKDYVERYNLSPDIAGSLSLRCAVYAPDAFLELVRGLETCAEGGERCRLCIGDRLEKTAIFAKLNGFEYFSTTLSVSRHKNHKMIAGIGKTLALRYGLTFEDEDYKKNGGEDRMAVLAKSYGLYRQNYCGCRFSKGR